MVRLFPSSLHHRLAISLLVASCTVLPAKAQIPPELAIGTSNEDVARKYGSPKGKTATVDREIWVFDGYRVTFFENRVVDVVPLMPSAIPPFGNRPKVPAARPAAPRPTPVTAQPPMPAPLPPRRSSPVYPPAATPVAPFVPIRIGPPPHSTDPNRLSIPLTSAPTTATPTQRPKTNGVLYAAIGVLAAATTILLTLGILRKKAAREKRRGNAFQGEPLTLTPTTPARTWEDQVRLQLQTVQTDRSSERAEPNPSPVIWTSDLIRDLEWKRFELLVVLYFRATGVSAEFTRPGADGGVDVVLTRPGENGPTGYVQCKAWGREPIGVALVRELYGVMAANRVPKGVFVTTSSFSSEARAFATSTQLTLLTTQDLLERISRLQPEIQANLMAEVTAGDYTTPSCPTCERKMVWKDKAGFWGCPQFPSCRSSPIYPRSKGSQ